MLKTGPIKKGVRVRRRDNGEAGRINSVYLNEDGSVAINVVWDDRRSGTYESQSIILDEWADSSD